MKEKKSKIKNLTNKEFEIYKNTITKNPNRKCFTNEYIFLKEKNFYIKISFGKIITEILYFDNEEFKNFFKTEIYDLSGNVIKVGNYNHKGWYDGYTEEKPAMTIFDEKGEIKREVFMKNGKYHCISGPAIREYNNALMIDESYYINDVRFTQNNFNTFINSIKDKTIFNTLNFCSMSKLETIKEIAEFFGIDSIVNDCNRFLVIKKLEGQAGALKS